MGGRIAEVAFNASAFARYSATTALDTEEYEIARHYVQGVSRETFQATSSDYRYHNMDDQIREPYGKTTTARPKAFATIVERLQELLIDVLATPDFSKKAEISLAKIDNWLTRLEEETSNYHAAVASF
jgi:hypothetical protein